MIQHRVLLVVYLPVRLLSVRLSDKIDHIGRYDQTCLQLGFLISSQYSNRVVRYLRVNGPFELVYDIGGGRVVRSCWINFQCRVCSTYLDKSRARAYCSCSRCGWGLFGHFSLVYHFTFLSPSLWETARYRLKYCPTGPLIPKQQPIVYDIVHIKQDTSSKI